MTIGIDTPSLRADVRMEGDTSRREEFSSWHETLKPDGSVREVYRPLQERLDGIPFRELKALDNRLEATMREMGVTFDISRERPWGKRPWYCDLLPQIFTPTEWDYVEKGLEQRLRAYELFLQDIYGEREILRSGNLPVQPVLGSAAYQRTAKGVKPPAGAYLHLCGAAFCRLPNGKLALKHHYFSNASGISYMMQNRRALTRVIPQSFQDVSMSSIVEASTHILESLRSLSEEVDPTVVLLSPGTGSAVYSEHSFLARRMGIPLVQGGDLLVLKDAVYLKTVSGLRRVEVIYSRIADQWLDPLAFRRDSLLGVPGLVHCIRRGTVALVNFIGSQVADDRALLPFSSAIISYYLGERPCIPTVPTYWLGDIDQRELVMSELWRYTIRPLHGERIVLGGDGRIPTEEEVEAARAEIMPNASQYVAQPQDIDALTTCYQDGLKTTRRQDHIVFGVRTGEERYHIFPGALTRVSTEESPFPANELGGGSKDTWVLLDHEDDDDMPRTAQKDAGLPSQYVSSRVAEAFYWLGRYLERANNLASMIGVIEVLELEELNPMERTLYKPVWNRILPPLENPGSVTRRTISSPAGRCRLTLDLEEPDSVVQTILRAAGNAESILECLSVEAWSVLDALRVRFQKARYRRKAPEAAMAALTRKQCAAVISAVPEFFGTAEATMIADGGWNFCLIGQHIERAIITANALNSIVRPMSNTQGSDPEDCEHEVEIRLSAFLRLLSSRDVYRRVYQMRIEPIPLLDLLWKNPVAPRSVSRCLSICAQYLAETSEESSPAIQRTLGLIETLVHEIRLSDWEELAGGDDLPTGRNNALLRQSKNLLEQVLSVHHLISDGFLNHQIHMESEVQPSLFGPENAL